MPAERVARKPYNLVGEAKPCNTDQNASSAPKIASVRAKVLAFTASDNTLTQRRKIRKYAVNSAPAAIVPCRYTVVCRTICRTTIAATATQGQTSEKPLEGNFCRPPASQNAASVAAPISCVTTAQGSTAPKASGANMSKASKP